MKAMHYTEMMAERPLEPDAIGISGRKLIVGSTLFLLLTIGVFAYQFSLAHAGSAAPRWDQLQWRYLILLVLCLPIETLAAASRIWLVGRVLQQGIGLWTCTKAEWANVAIAALTPSQTGGGPAQIYILSRAGATPATALTISLLSFVGTMIGLFAMGIYSIFVSGIGDAGVFYMAAAWTLIAIGAAMILTALSPNLLRRLLGALSRTIWRLRAKRYNLCDWRPPDAEPTGQPIDRLDRITIKLVDLIYHYHNDLGRFFTAGKLNFAWISLLSIVFLVARCLIPYLCIRFLGIEGAGLRQTIETQMALIFLIFFGPTPGGAGLAESASLSIMAAIVPEGLASAYNLLWRFSTLYWAAIAGLICLAHAVTHDGAKLVTRSKPMNTKWRIRQ